MLKEIFFIVSIIALLHKNVESFKDPLTANGRSVMVHLFEWKWGDIAAECERFLGPKGFGGIQVSPPNEHALVNNPYRPWWQRYQPVSYKIISRSGNEAEFRDMVNRCNNAGVRIYVDAIINHMSAACCQSSGGTPFNTGQLSYAMYGRSDFNDGKCRTASGNIENYADVNQVRDCRLVGLPDLATGNEYVRQTLANFMNSLIDMGVAGFRIDAAKHMWPGDLQAIYGKLKNVREDIFGAGKRPFIYQEVIDLGGEPIKNTDYTGIGRVTEFRYGQKLSEVVNKENGQKMRWLQNFGVGWGFIADGDSVSFVDNHDNQRGHGGGGNIITFFESRKYKIANSFMLAWPYGFAQIMSSYLFDKNNDAQGPPGSNGETSNVVINSDGSCGGGWICEHRWRQIANMVKFRNIAGSEPVLNWWDNQNNQIAFSRGNKAFIAINNDAFAMDATLKTGLPSGTYCDVNSGDKVNGACTGRTVTVNGDGTARINIKFYEEDPIIAIHIESKL